MAGPVIQDMTTVMPLRRHKIVTRQTCVGQPERWIVPMLLQETIGLYRKSDCLCNSKSLVRPLHFNGLSGDSSFWNSRASPLLPLSVGGLGPVLAHVMVLADECGQPDLRRAQQYASKCQPGDIFEHVCVLNCFHRGFTPGEGCM